MPKQVFESCRLAEPMLLVMINGDGETCCRMPTHSTRDGKHVLERIEWLNGQTTIVTILRVLGGGHDVIGWRAPWQALLGLPPRGPATATAIVATFAGLNSRLP